MDDFEIALVEAWRKHRGRILADPGELQRRLARRRLGVMMRPARAWCLAVRASDTRVDPFAFACVPEDAAYPARYRADHSTAYYGRHTARLTAEGLRQICRPVRITPPGQTMQEVADLLGRQPDDLRYAMCRGMFKIHYVPHLGGNRGRPVPLIYADRLFDPSAGHLGVRPDPIWGTIWQGLGDLLPDDFEQTLTRIPVYRKRGPMPFDADRPSWPRRSNRLPPAPLDWVWYKWKDGKPIAEMHRKRGGKKKAGNAGLAQSGHSVSEGFHPHPGPLPGRERGHDPNQRIFCGWNWICPGCKRAVRVVYYPLAAFNVLEFLNEEIPAHEADELQKPPPTFACRRCHRVQSFSGINRSDWNHLVCQLSGGMLYGHEVPRPKSFIAVRRQKYRAHLRRPPSRRREEVLELLLAGRSNGQMAEELGIGRNTVKSYVQEVYRQERVHSRGELCRRKGAAPPLSPRCQRVLPRLVAGDSYKEIAREVNGTVVAVSQLATRIYRRYGVHSRGELADQHNRAAISKSAPSAASPGRSGRIRPADRSSTTVASS